MHDLFLLCLIDYKKVILDSIVNDDKKKKTQ